MVQASKSMLYSVLGRITIQFCISNHAFFEFNPNNQKRLNGFVSYLIQLGAFVSFCFFSTLYPTWKIVEVSYWMIGWDMNLWKVKKNKIILHVCHRCHYCFCNEIKFFLQHMKDRVSKWKWVCWYARIRI